MRCDVSEDKSDALFKAASANVEPFWPGLFAKALATPHQHWEPPGAGAKPAGHLISSTTALPAEKKVEAKKNESGESNGDMGSGLCD